MSVRLSVKLPEEAFSALRTTPEDFVKEMRLAAAVKSYELDLLSQAKAVEVAGVTRHELFDALSRFKVSLFQTSPEQLADVLGRTETLGYQRLAPDPPRKDWSTRPALPVGRVSGPPTQGCG